MTTTYTTKALAISAARTALKLAGIKDAMSEVHFRLGQTGDEWGWHQIDVGTGLMATGELIVDGAGPAVPALPPVTKVAPRTGGKAKSPVPIAKLSKREQARRAKIAASDAAAKLPKPPKAPRVKAAKTPSVKAERQAQAERGILPTAPDFTADTHKRFRKVLAQLVDFAAAGNLKGLKADTTQPLSSSRVSLCRYRDLAITALEAQRKAAKAAPKAA